jgi:hypothetical protein
MFWRYEALVLKICHSICCSTFLKYFPKLIKFQFSFFRKLKYSALKLSKFISIKNNLKLNFVLFNRIVDQKDKSFSLGLAGGFMCIFGKNNLSNFWIFLNLITTYSAIFINAHSIHTIPTSVWSHYWRGLSCMGNSLWSKR